MVHLVVHDPVALLASACYVPLVVTHITHPSNHPPTHQITHPPTPPNPPPPKQGTLDEVRYRYAISVAAQHPRDLERAYDPLSSTL